MSFGDHSNNNRKNARQQSSNSPTTRWTRTAQATRNSMPSTSSAFTYDCTLCIKSFKLPSLLAAHKLEHELGFQARSNQRRETATGEALHNRCRYCDRHFELERTLHIHQLEHCTKIMPQERRKLRYNELSHEGRAAPLPKFHRDVPSTAPRAVAGAMASSSVSESSSAVLGSPRIAEKSRDWNLQRMTSSSNVNVSVGRSVKPKATTVRQRNNNNSNDNNNKLIPCFVCKMSFESLGELSVHTRAVHSRDCKGHDE